MIIKSVTLQRVDSGTTRPIAQSLGLAATSSGYLVRITAQGGAVGIGWAHESPFLAGETADSIRGSIEQVMAPYLIGKSAHDIAALMEGLEKRLIFNYRAKSAIDIALHDLVARAAGLKLHAWLGGLSRPRIDCIRILGVDSPAEMAREAAELRALGFRHFKLKVNAAESDFDRVKAVAETLAPGGCLILDANQAYSPKAAINFANRLAAVPAVKILEQPVPETDLDGLALVRRSIDQLVAADEAVRTPADALRVIDKRAADMICLKVPKMGGLYWTRQIADVCKAAGLPNIIGGTLGSAILDLAHVHFALSHPNVSAFGSEIGESQRLTEDVARGLDVRDGWAYPPEAAGTGAVLLEQQS